MRKNISDIRERKNQHLSKQYTNLLYSPWRSLDMELALFWPSDSYMIKIKILESKPSNGYKLWTNRGEQLDLEF